MTPPFSQLTRSMERAGIFIDPLWLPLALTAVAAKALGAGASMHIEEALSLVERQIPSPLLSSLSGRPSSKSESATWNALMRLELSGGAPVCAMLHELAASGSVKRRRGAIYTPHQLAALLCDEVFARQGRFRAPLTVLDPACGGGMLLVTALRRLVVHQGYPVEQVADCMHGADIDPQAVEVSRFTVMLEARILGDRSADLAKRVNARIVCGNSLVEPKDVTTDEARRLLSPLDWRGCHAGDFDCIVANPPYGLSRNEQLSELENRILSARYDAVRDGKVNKYLLFLARGLELLADDGVLGFIVPNAWLGIRGGRPLRRKLLAERSFAKVISFESSPFDEPSVEPIIAVVDRTKQHEAIQLEERAGDAPYEARSENLLPVESCLRVHDQLIPLLWEVGAEELLNAVTSASVLLGAPDSPFIPYIALQAYARGKGTPPQTEETSRERCFHTSSAVDEHCVPYLEGGDVGRYSLDWSGGFLRYGPWLAEHHPLSRFEGARVLVREILGAAPHLVKAVVTAERYLYNRSVLHILPKSGTAEWKVWALCGILNSVIGSLVLRFHGRKSQRKLFPKLVNDDLKGFPFPRAESDALRQLAELARRMTVAGGRMEPEERERLEREADRCAATAFGLPAEAVSRCRLLLGGQTTPKQSSSPAAVAV